jgi:hypothetical protein
MSPKRSTYHDGKQVRVISSNVFGFCYSSQARDVSEVAECFVSAGEPNMTRG